MTVRITINDTREILVEPGRSLLSALRESQVYLLSACGGRGACGTCRVKVLDGVSSDQTPSERHWLSPEDAAAGVRLACQVNVERDMRIQVAADTFDIREYRTRTVSLRDLTHDIKEVRLKLLDPPGMVFKAGQFVQFKVPQSLADTPHYRSFSIASDPRTKDELVFQIRYVPKGLCTTYIHKQMKVGDELTILGPWGSCYLRESDRDIVFIAGGSGMSPVRSILLDMSNRGCSRKMQYFFGAKAARDLYRVEEMREIERRLPHFTFIPALSDPDPGDNWTGETGIITEVAARHLQANRPTDAYLCGSPMMVNACIRMLTSKGVTEGSIFYDRFV